MGHAHCRYPSNVHAVRICVEMALKAIRVLWRKPHHQASFTALATKMSVVARSERQEPRISSQDARTPSCIMMLVRCQTRTLKCIAGPMCGIVHIGAVSLKSAHLLINALDTSR